MYCNPDTVKLLAKNVRNGLTEGEILAASELVDPDIDAKLAARYYWPVSSSGQDLRSSPPPQVRAIANYLVAALLESNHTAFSAATLGPEANQHPYGQTLERLGSRKLRQAVDGPDVIRELESRAPGRVSRAKPSFRGTSGFSGDYTSGGRRCR